jgi:hypothetical protein
LVKSHSVRFVRCSSDAPPAPTDLEPFTSPAQKLEPGAYIINAGKRWKKVIV